MVGDGPLDSLRALPLFAGLDDAVLRRVAEIATELDVPEGQLLIQRDDPASGMFVVLEGTVAVDLPGRTVELGPGECVGELALLVPDATRSARVRAATPVRCLAVGRSEFDALLESEHALALALLRTVARRLLDAAARD